ncbi:MAG TPA: nucleoside triphosphate pyrophosphohydrolase [Stellaceae bacterium]|nr:nucleoside triphosphate pyrophosphohydrolase [Stellaceae bacterium]
MPDSPDLLRLLDIMARLRDPDSGCPWDLEQSFASIAPYTIEEAYEVAEAAERGDIAALKDELGDLLLQVVFHARMAEEAGRFAFNDVARSIAEKMIRRHPHVFADATVAGSAAQTRAWEDQKAVERRVKAAAEGRAESALDGVGPGLPALTRAEKLQKRAARVGFDWAEPGPIFDKIEEEIGELHREIAGGGTPARLEDELGDLLFAVTNLARHLRIDPEQALRGANRKFERRFRRIEERLAAAGRSPANTSLEEMEAEWQRAKAEEQARP